MSRSVRLIFTLALLLASTACSSHPNEEADQLFAAIQAGDDKLICTFVYGCERLNPDAQGALIARLKPLRGPADKKLQVTARRQEERLQMLIVRVPWQPSDSSDAFQPVLTTRNSGMVQIVGFVLPFDDIVPLLNPEEMREAVGLGVLWIDWINSGGQLVLRKPGA